MQSVSCPREPNPQTNNLHPKLAEYHEVRHTRQQWSSRLAALTLLTTVTATAMIMSKYFITHVLGFFAAVVTQIFRRFHAAP
jgi:hypothetical protein